MDFKTLFPNYDVTEDGRIFKNGIYMKPFKSNKYDQVLLFDADHKRHIMGVHSVVAMKYLPNYYKGCIVHHKDENTHNNSVRNLEILSRAEHARHHVIESEYFRYSRKGVEPWNKGLKMSEEFCRKCRESANKNKRQRTFHGNQYIDQYGNRKMPVTQVV